MNVTIARRCVATCRAHANASATWISAGSNGTNRLYEHAPIAAVHVRQMSSNGGESKKRGFFDDLKAAFSKDARKARRDKLNQEIQTSYFQDMRTLGKGAGEAQLDLFPANKAVSLPGIDIVNAKGKEAVLDTELQGQVSFLSIAFRQSAVVGIQSWQTPFEESLAGELSSKRIKIFELSFMEGALLKMAKSRFIAGLNKSIPEPRASNYLLHFGDSKPYVKDLGVSNKLVGYVYLLDSQGRIRWRGAGASTPEAVDAMVGCAKQLIVECRTGGKGKGKRARKAAASEATQPADAAPEAEGGNDSGKSA